MKGLREFGACLIARLMKDARLERWPMAFAVGCALACSIAGTEPPAWAQVDTGSIQGRVIDRSGASVPAASVVIRNEATGFAQTVQAGADGLYLFTPVKVGMYSVEGSATGFAPVREDHISVSIQQQVVVDLHLAVGAVQSVVEVSTAEPVLQTQSAAVGQVIAGPQINAMPLNGRNYTLLAQLAPGTTTTVYDSGHGEIQSGTFVANGATEVFNNYLLDGITNNSDAADFGNGTSYALKPPPEALAEFRVETANYSAEYGRSGGAVINAVTRSGGNSLFGNVWEYLRNSGLDANDYFLNRGGVARPEYRRNQFGFALGGPVYLPHIYNGHNKTFFFMDYEGQRIRQGEGYTSSVPTALERSSGFTNYSDLLAYQTGNQTDILGRTTPIGTVFDPATTRYLSKGYADPVTGLVATSAGYVREAFAGNIVPAARISSVSAGLLALYPAPNAKGGGINNNYVSAPVLQASFDGFDLRVDQNFSDKDQFFGRVSYTFNPEIIPTPCPGLAECDASATIGNQDTTIFGAAVGETHVFSPHLVNEIRIGYNRIHMNRLAPFGSEGGLNEQYGIPGIPDGPGNGGLTQMNISGLSQLGSHNNNPLDEIGSEGQYNDNVSLEVGRHSLRFGGQYEGIKNALYSSQFPHGYFTFTGGYTDQSTPAGTNAANTGIAQFALQPVNASVAGCNILSNTQGPPTTAGCYTYNNVGGASNIQASPLSQQDYRKPYFGAYFTDTWKITPKLTLNLGLRYEYFSLGADHFGRAANFVPSFASKDGSSEYLIDDRSKNIALSPSFTSLLAAQGIALSYTSNHDLGELPKTNFSPRLGFAWQLMPRTVLRGGYGIFYAGIYARGDGYNTGDNYPFAFGVNLASSTSGGISNDASIGPISSGLANVPLTPSSVIGSQIGPRGIQYYAHVPSLQDINLTLQYQMAGSQYFEIGYVGTLARHIESDIYSNTVSELLPVVLPAGTSLNNYVPYPGLPRSNYYQWLEGANNYNSLQTKYEKLFSHGTNLIADYTWSKALGYGSDSNVFSSTSYRAPHVPGFGMQGDYGELDFESKYVFHMGGGWQLPAGVGRRWVNHRGIGNLLLGGWNLNAIVTYQSGQPVNVGCSSSTSNSLGCNSFVQSGALYQGGKTVTHWFNAGAFTNPPQVETVGQTDYTPLGQKPSQGAYGPAFHRGDVSVQKFFSLTEKTNLEFRAEAFNLTNTPNFGPPGTLTPTSSSFASITTTRDNPSDARELQFALKLNFGVARQ
jgi:Carboxypeptidase regulatory-like domain/TonB dependent receptor/TonB-dependent Receptor Plug Domain